MRVEHKMRFFVIEMLFTSEPLFKLKKKCVHECNYSPNIQKTLESKCLEMTNHETTEGKYMLFTASFPQSLTSDFVDSLSIF